MYKKNKNWKTIAAIAMSFSMMVTAGIGAFASSKGENKAESTLDIAGAAEPGTTEESGSLLDLADSMSSVSDEEENEDDGLLALIDNEEDADDAAEGSAPEEEAPAAAEEEAPAAEAAEEAPAAEEEEAPAPEQDDAAVLDQAVQEEDKEEETEEAPVNYEKLSTTGSVSDGIIALDVSTIVENTLPSIVSVTTSSAQKVRDFFSGQEYEEITGGSGSGIIISQNSTELLVVTNHHITEDATELSVAFSVEAENEDDLIVPAVLKGESNKADLAVLAVKLSDIKPEVYEQLKIATLGSSDKLEVGEAAIVIGNALGYGLSASAGIVSALDRDVVTGLGTFKEFMVDAPINLGCSGGAILNSKGEVVGIVNCKDVNDYAESMGYGVPIDTAIPILQNLINRETRDVVENHGFLGVTVVPVSEEARTMYDMPAGAYVYEVSEGSAAEKAGIEKGNIITTFDGIEVEGSDDLVSLVSRYEVGETVNVTLQVPDGSSYVEKVVEVTLQEGVQTDDTNDQPSIPQEQEEKDDYQNSPENYNYGMGEDQYGDLFEWLFGNNSREDQDGWGSFFYGRN